MDLGAQLLRKSLSAKGEGFGTFLAVPMKVCFASWITPRTLSARAMHLYEEVNATRRKDWLSVGKEALVSLSDAAP
jgi:hypothetical protein